jgi:PKD repeat protein
MKKNILVVLILLFSLASTAQPAIDIGGIGIAPTAPVCNDSLEISLNTYITCYSGYNLDSVVVKISGLTITVQQHWTCVSCACSSLSKIPFTYKAVPTVPGTYSVVGEEYIGGTLVDSESTSVKIGTCCAAKADFTWLPDVGCPGNAINFSNTSTNAVSYRWRQNGSLFSTSTHTSFSFSTAGTYLVSLAASTGSCDDSVAKLINVIDGAHADPFSYIATNKDYDFTDQSTGNQNEEYLWDFGDGNTDTSHHPHHAYHDTGHYTVCLTITNTCGQDSVCESITVTCPLPLAGFNVMSDSLDVQLTDLSDHTTQWYWTFGDGNFTAVKDPSYTYASPGTYEICLIASSDCGSDTTCQTITVGPVGLATPTRTRLILHPNPFSDAATLFLEQQPTSIRITDLLGRDVTNSFRVERNGHILRLYNHEKANGTFIIRIDHQVGIIQVY